MPRPAALRPGDGIAVVAPASPFDKERFERGVRALQDIGLEPRFGKGVFERHQGYLAGDDKRRLAVLARRRGTPLQPSFNRCVVLLADLTEPPYRLDPLCTQLLQSGAFEGPKGIVVGDLFGTGETSEGRNEVLAERFEPLGIPLV